MDNAKFDEIKLTFLQRLNVEELEETKPLKELGLDSLDVVEMCLDFEDKYGIQFETEELSSFKTVGDLFKALQEKLS